MTRWSSTTVDLISDGVPRRDRDQHGDRAVWSALVRTAASAMQRGVERPEWAAFVTEPGRQLGVQASVRRGKPRTRRDVERTLSNAWVAAERWLAEHPPLTSDDIRDRIALVRDFVADASVPVNATERAILAHAVDRAVECSSVRPAMPRAGMIAAVGVGLTALRTSLERLDEAGLLRCEVRGKPGGARARSRRANCYGLPTRGAIDAYLYRETRCVVPQGQVCGAPEIPSSGALASSVVPHVGDEGDDAMVTLTLKAADPAKLAEAIRLLGQHQVLVTTEQHDLDQAEQHDLDNVRPLRGRHAS